MEGFPVQQEIDEFREDQRMQANLVITEQIGLGVGAITSEELTQEQAEVNAREVSSHEVELEKIVDENGNIFYPALGVCIDGRTGELLGVKMAGGYKTLQVAAKSVGYDVEGPALFERAKSRGFNLGAHVDSTNRAEGFVNGTGCGANDKEEIIDGLFTEHKASLMATAEALININGKFDGGVYDSTSLTLTTNDKNELRNTVGEASVETLRDDHEGVHGHREWAVYFNYVEGTTIDRDAYFEATGKQVFVVDMWYIKRLADGMAEGIDAEQQASELYHAMVAYQLATYVALCDGKHRAIIATQKQFATAA
jgi:hypothetical protein